METRGPGRGSKGHAGGGLTVGAAKVETTGNAWINRAQWGGE